MGRQLTEDDRDLLIKEARQAALHDVRQALARMQDRYGKDDPDLKRFAQYFSQCLGEKLTEVAQDAEGSGYPRVNHAVWGSEE